MCLGLYNKSFALFNDLFECLLTERDPQEDIQLVSNFLAYRNKKDLEIIDLDEGEKNDICPIQTTFKKSSHPRRRI
jgi:hypothetical protein